MRLTFDVWGDRDPPEPDAILRPDWPLGRAWYRVLDVRPVESRVHPNRWRLEVVRVPPGTEGAEVWPYVRN